MSSPPEAPQPNIKTRIGSLFSRRRHEDEGPTLPTYNQPSSWQQHRGKLKAKPYTMESRPTFLEWLKITALDIATLIAMAILAYVFFLQPAASHRTFPITFNQEIAVPSSLGSQSSGDIVYPQFAHPYRDQFISSEAASGLAIGVPIIVFLLTQIRIRSFWDLNNSILGLLYSVTSATLFQVMIKWLIGGLRPNFLDVCQPNPTLAMRPGGNATGLEGTGYGGIMYTYEICSNMDDEKQRRRVFNALQSFPSGHTTASFAGFVFLYLYLNAKLKVFSNYHPSLWKLALLYAPILCAVLIGGSLTVDQSHNWYDVLAGAAIGTTFAFSAYRMVYAAVWDWRVNHIPLHRRDAFSHDAVGEETVGLRWTMTRHAGWGGTTARDDTDSNKKLPVDEGRTRTDSSSPARSGFFTAAHSVRAIRPSVGGRISRKSVGMGAGRNGRAGDDIV